MKSYKNVDAYISDQAEASIPLLEKLRAVIRKAAPKAEESVSYGMAAYKLAGPLVYFGAFKDHIGFFPTPSGVANFEKELKGYTTSKGTIHFELDKPIPVKLVTAIVKFRVEENLQRQAMKELTKKKPKKKA